MLFPVRQSKELKGPRLQNGQDPTKLLGSETVFAGGVTFQRAAVPPWSDGVLT